MNLKHGCVQALATSIQKGWWDGCVVDGVLSRERVIREIPRMVALIHAEVSEALEEARKGAFVSREEPDGKHVGLGAELADVVILVMVLSEALGVDLALEVEKKMRYNESRPRRHGDKPF